MRERFRLLAVIVLAFTAAAVIAAAAARGGNGDDDDDDGGGVLTFRADLTGDEEVPPVDTETTGEVRIRFNDSLTAAEFRLKVRDGVRITQAHIHCGPTGQNGPVVVFLAGLISTGVEVDGWWIDNATITDANIINTACGTTLAELAMQMMAGNTYANVHSLAHPGGEVRGQLELVVGGGDDDDD